MSGHSKWSEIRHKGSDPERIAALSRLLERRQNRPWWRLVRLWDRLR